MNFMTERKAQEKLQAYLIAEVAGRNDEAAALEQELNDAGWFIVTGPDGLTLKKNEREIGLPSVDDFYLPRESTSAPVPASSDSPNRTLWIALGITASVILVTILVIIIVKRHQKNAQLRGLPQGG